MELSLNQFFMHIRYSLPYTSLEIHNNIEFYTDNFNPKKLEILKKDFESFLRTERKKFSNRFSIEDIDKAVLEFNCNKAEKIEYKNLSNNKKLDLVEKLLFPNEFYACYHFLDMLLAQIKDQKGSSINFFKPQIEGIDDQFFPSDLSLAPIAKQESSDNDLKLIIEDFLEQFLNNGSLWDGDYKKTFDIFEAFFNKKSFLRANPIKFRAKIKKAFASECGKMYREVNGSKPISLDFLKLIKQNFDAYKDEVIDENRFQKSNIYKYLTT